jgi:hypothetical protein
MGRKSTFNLPCKKCPICKSLKPLSNYRTGKALKFSLVCNHCFSTRWPEVRAFYADTPQVEIFKRAQRTERALELRRRYYLARNYFYGEGVIEMARGDPALQLLKLPERIAAILGKTYAVRGDDATLADDQALMMIRDELDDYDEKIIERNKNKRLTRR